MKFLLIFVCGLCSCIFSACNVWAEDVMWVNVDRLERRTCPDEKCGLVGELFFREKVAVYDVKDGWIRSTRPYVAMCENGGSRFVKNGLDVCSESNGIVNGYFSEWVKQGGVAAVRPEDPALNDDFSYDIVKGSDDYRVYKDRFLSVAHDLIGKGVCSKRDFLEYGGWLKSSEYRAQPIYFTYCKDAGRGGKVMLNVETGEVF